LPCFLFSALLITAMYGTNFNLKIFTDITMPVIWFGIGYIGKVSQVLKKQAFYGILSIYLYRLISDCFLTHCILARITLRM